MTAERFEYLVKDLAKSLGCNIETDPAFEDKYEVRNFDLFKDDTYCVNFHYSYGRAYYYSHMWHSYKPVTEKQIKNFKTTILKESL